MANKSYGGKLKDPRWQKKRLEILSRDEFTCRYCKDNKTTLHIHHLEYKGDPWEVDNDKLITLCEDCHSVIELNSEGVKGEVIGCIKQQLEVYTFITIVFRKDENKIASVYEINENGMFHRYSMNWKYLRLLIELMER